MTILVTLTPTLSRQETYKKRTKDAWAGEGENLYQGGMGGCRPHSTLDPSFPCDLQQYARF